MGYKPPGSGKDFQKGNPGGPGRPKLSEELKALKPLTKEEYNRLLNKFLDMTKAELQEALKNPTLSAKELAIASIVAKSITQGDHGKWESILNRAIGPVPKPVEMSGVDSGPIEMIIRDYRDKKEEDQKD